MTYNIAQKTIIFFIYYYYWQMEYLIIWTIQYYYTCEIFYVKYVDKNILQVYNDYRRLGKPLIKN